MTILANLFKDLRLNCKTLVLLFLSFSFFLCGKGEAQVIPTPAGIATMSPYNGQVNLTWQSVTGATSYAIARDPYYTSTPITPGVPTNTPVPTSTPIAIIQASSLVVSTTTPNFTDYQVTDGQVYQYSVWGIASNGNTGASAQVTALPFTMPDAINLTVQNIHNNALDLSWSIPLSTYPIVSYNVYRQTSISTPTGYTMPVTQFFTPSPAPIAVVTTPSYSDQNIPGGGVQSVYYMVVGVDSNSVTGSYASNSSTGAYPTSTMPPVAPVLSGYAPAVQTGTTTATTTPIYGVQLYWNGPLSAENVTQFQILSNGTAIATVLITPTPLPTYSYLDTSLSPSSASGPVSVYSIISMNANGAVTSNQVQGTMIRPSMNNGANATPSGGIQVTPNSTSNSVTISWAAGNPGTYGLLGYNVYWSPNGGPPVPYPIMTLTPGVTLTATPTPFVMIIETPSKTPTYMATVSLTNANNTYWVQPFYSIPTSVSTIPIWGDTISTTLHLAPTPVTAVTANQITNSNNGVTVSWTGASPGYYGSITNYAIYRTYNSGTPTIIATVAATRSMKSDYVDVISGPAAYAYAVGAVDALGNISDLTVLSNQITLSSLPSFSPKTPRALPAIQTSSNMVLSWLLNPASDAVTGYAVYGPDYYSVLSMTGNTPTPTMVAPATAVPLSVALPSNWAGVTYFVQAVNSVNGVAAYSQPATLSAIAVPAYTINALVPTPTQGVSITWSLVPAANATVDSWVIYRSSATPTPGGDTQLRPVTVIPIATTAYLDTSVMPGVAYSYFVTARSDLNATPGGTPVAESPLQVAGVTPATTITWPNIPVGFTANTGSNATTLIWSNNVASDDVKNYTVFHNGTPTCTVGPSTTVSVIMAETPGVVSTYQIEANNLSGPSNSSVTLAVFPIPSITPVISMNTPNAYVPLATITPGIWISGVTFPSGGAQECTVYRTTNTAFSAPTSIGVLNSTTTVLEDSSPVTGYVNYYTFIADNGAGVTANYNLSEVMNINVWPNSPSAFMAVAGSNAVTLSWTAPVTGSLPVTAYDVYRGTMPGAETPYATAIRTNPYVDATVTPGVPYYYYMDAISANLKSAATSESAVMPGPSLALSGGSGVSQGILTWAPVTQVTTPAFSSFVVKRLALSTPVAAIAVATFTVPTVTNTTYTDTTTGYSTGYVYQVAPVAIATTGENIYGAYSNPVTITVPPQGPNTISAVSGDQLAQVRWNYQGVAAAGAYTYSIQRKLGTAATSAFQTIASGLTGLDYTDTGLLDKTLYNYQVLAIDPKTTMIGYSPIANALPAHPPVVDNPNLTLVQTQSGNTISWAAANSGVTDFNSATMYPLGGYHVYRSSDGGGTYQLLNSQGTTTTSYTDNVTIINGVTYTYLVRAYDAPPNVSTTDPNMVHETTYNTVTATGLSASVALDRNSIRPAGSYDASGSLSTGNEQVVHIRFVVTNPCTVTIKVYSISGVFIKQLVSQYFGVGVYGVGGNYPLQWDGRNTNGSLVASGVYMVTTEMSGTGFQDIEKIAVIK